MNIFAKFDEDRTLVGVSVCLSSTSAYPLRIKNVVMGNRIHLRSRVVEFDVFLKNLKHCTIDESGNVTVKPGAVFDDGHIELDTSIPMAYTRANTVVNFGSL